MPQDIPLESSDTLEFTPESLSKLKSPPVFTLRAPTKRDNRWMKRMLREAGVSQHSVEDLRAEMLAALKPLWGEAAYEENAEKLKAYWQASDDFALQRKDDPDLVWEYDPATEAAVNQLELDVAKHHAPFAKMRADNADASEVSMLALAAVVITGWTGVGTDPVLDRGYLSIDGIDNLRDELLKLDGEANPKADPGRSWAELLVACTKRMFLGEDEEKNSASPSPLPTAPESSRPGKAATTGQSQASASSTETPADA